MAEEQHDRSVVDVAFRQGRRGIGIGRVEDLDRRRRRRAAKRCAGAGERRRADAPAGGIGQEPVEGRVLEGDAGVQHGVRTSKRSRTSTSPATWSWCGWLRTRRSIRRAKNGQVGAEAPQRELRVGPAVDQHGRAARRLDQDRVALADVEHGEVQPAIGSRGDRDRRAGPPRGRQRSAPGAAAAGQRPAALARRSADGRVSRRVDRRAGPRWRGRASGARRPRTARGAQTSTAASGTRGDRRAQLDDHAAGTSQAAPPASHVDRVADRSGRAAAGIERPRHGRQRAEQHGHRHEGDDENIRNRRDEREALEVDQDDRQGRELGGERQRDRLADPAPANAGRRRSTAPPNQMRPAVASSDSWKPTSHRTDGAASSMTSAASASADAACAREPPRRRDQHRARHERRAHDRRAGARSAARSRRPWLRHQRGRPSAARASLSGPTTAVTSAATMAMFQPEMATTWVRPAVAKASLISGAIDARTPSRIPAPSAASGSGTMSFSPSSSAARSPARIGSRPARAGSTSADLARAIAPMPWRCQVLAIREAVEVLGASPPRAAPAADRPLQRRNLAAATRAAGRSSGRWAAVPIDEVAEHELEPILARPRIVGTVPTISCSAPSARQRPTSQPAAASATARRRAMPRPPMATLPRRRGRDASPAPAAMDGAAGSQERRERRPGDGAAIASESADQDPARDARPASAAGRDRAGPTVSRRSRRPGCPPAGRGG